MKRWIHCLMTGLLVAGLAASLPGCIERFEPEIKQPTSNYLVINGFINSNGITTITLNRSVGLDGSNSAVPAERKATVYIEDDQNGRYPLAEGENGVYTSRPLALSSTRTYRLYLRTVTGREYASEYTAAKTTPPIDAVTWQIVPEGIQVFVSAHDDQNQTRYYRWNYEETWEFTSAFQSVLDEQDGVIRRRLNDIYHCWRTENSTLIKIGNSTRLSQDVISDHPLLLVPTALPKLRYKYSILVRQYALSQEEYDYLELLRKNTENLGTLFDPLPSQLTGNVRCLSDATEPVIGFVGAHSVQEKRIFINRNELPEQWRVGTGYESCGYTPDTVKKKMSSIFQARPVMYIPIEEVMDADGDSAYTFYTIDCVDCRKRGSSTRPSFWPQ